MTFEEAENTHNDINRWWAAGISGSAAPSDYKALWQTSNNSKGGGKQRMPKCVSVDKICALLHICIHV